MPSTDKSTPSDKDTIDSATPKSTKHPISLHSILINSIISIKTVIPSSHPSGPTKTKPFSKTSHFVS